MKFGMVSTLGGQYYATYALLLFSLTAKLYYTTSDWSGDKVNFIRSE